MLPDWAQIGLPCFPLATKRAADWLLSPGSQEAKQKQSRAGQTVLGAPKETFKAAAWARETVQHHRDPRQRPALQDHEGHLELWPSTNSVPFLRALPTVELDFRLIQPKDVDSGEEP
ncbi:hypothetical protein CNYM01_02180 [Colletotrichum nymphaeae SA-01]|uniref:Uncharacterized protein n=1 Tax=Colletotrichum nymphaeae SA-01 TaxID=1460502 RepID=A0A135TW15_9PEZI|nr:hypothetical protein CNYM01_02180 [Colletotrichum nymphaeae SA-01]